MNLQALLDFETEPVEQAYSARDTMLYALGLAIGQDPVDPDLLAYVYENDLKVLPSMSNVLAHPGFWLKDPKLGVDWTKALHGDQRFIVHSPVPAEGFVVGKTRVLGVEDKGTSKGALLFYEKVLRDKASGAKLCTVQSSGFLRGDGGCGSGGEILPALEPVPTRVPDKTMNLPTYAQTALLYRLSGDRNPLHADPAVATKAGFDKPILHGLATMGIACFGLIKLFCEGDPDRLKEMAVRFSGVVYPGETICLEAWHEDDAIRFCARVAERLVLDCGEAACT